MFELFSAACCWDFWKHLYTLRSNRAGWRDSSIPAHHGQQDTALHSHSVLSPGIAVSSRTLNCFTSTASPLHNLFSFSSSHIPYRYSLNFFVI